MPKSNKDVTKIFKSLGPGDNLSKAVANASVREMEQRWPLLKTTPPQKLEQTPELSEDERQHWLSSPKTRSNNRKQVLSVPSSTSKDRLAESLKKMAGSQSKPKLSASVARPKPESVVVAPNIKPTTQFRSNVDAKKIEPAKLSTHLKKTLEAETIIETKPIVENKKPIAIQKVFAEKTSIVVKSSAAKVVEATQVPVEENRSLRGIFGRLSGKKIEPVQATPTPVQAAAPVKISVLRKLSKR